MPKPRFSVTTTSVLYQSSRSQQTMLPWERANVRSRLTLQMLVAAQLVLWVILLVIFVLS